MGRSHISTCTPRSSADAWRCITDQSDKDFTSKLNLVVVIRTTISPSLFPLSKLSPIRNSVRPSNLPAGTAPPPTPLYNSSLASDSLAPYHLLYLHNLSTSLPSFKDASLLLQLWGAQRGFGAELAWPGPGGWSLWCEMVLGYLVNGGGMGKVEGNRRITRGMSSYQAFRGVLDFFAHHDFTKVPIFMKNTLAAPEDVKTIPAEDWAAAGFAAVFVEPVGAVNLLAGVERGVLQVMGLDASTTLAMLDVEEGEAEGEDVFEGVFLRSLKSGPSRYDAVVR